MRDREEDKVEDDNFWFSFSYCVLFAVLSLGEEHFSAHQQPYLYFQVLMLTIQFEAVSALHTHIIVLHAFLKCT